ncbi:hypothetical protein WMF27_44570 [Sorangium sp. So ce281]|uniref:hypothetical protein n=1 Tax=unclassified Sorangium TaxID=2621164 RepID=UPI003F614092
MNAGSLLRAGIEASNRTECLASRERANVAAGPSARARRPGAVTSAARERVARVVAALALAAAAGCGDGDGDDLPDPGPSSGLSPELPLFDLPEADAATLCDWVAGRFGGYGRRVDCGGGAFVSSAPSRAECVRSYQAADDTCAATIGVVEACVNGAVEGPCTALPVDCVELLFCAR